ncbi:MULTISPECIES: hypothetical protein [unclassified Bradyrhizobium]|uniref:hypothetical protein n=1 Tax=unclassified Bradyrhizobium TaxID=2631580 RepID=UPI001FF9C8D9|nr:MULTISPECIES: hypothetical protein [unclassified Bradyrhizobium]MCK1611048.1 hypothetical protein [Bradyrhizobium sp. 163]MCK1762802.1 hypothetical protein [Bradyrhizobium sp. 136]
MKTLPADLERLMELVVTRHVWGRKLAAEQMQETLASALDEGRRHLVTVREEEDGRLGIEFDPELGDVGRAFVEASKALPLSRPS